MFGALGTVWAEMGLDSTKLDMGVAKASASLRGLKSEQAAMTSAMKNAAVGFGLVGAAIATGAVVMAAKYDESMRKVWSLTKESEATFERWKSKVLEASQNLPQFATEMGDAMYWITSNMPDASESERFKTLDIAARGAVAGVAELSDTVNALTQAQNAYQDNTNPQRYMDVMNKTVERGSITLQEFVNNQGKYIGSAALANISIEETSAAMATLTRNAVPADTAAMALNQTIMSFLKPTDEAIKTASNYGIELSLTALRSKGLAGALMEIAQKIPDEELAQMFPNIRALKAVLPLASNVTEQFAEDLLQMGAAAGTTDRMFEKNSQSIGNKWRTMIGKAQNALINFGDKALPAVSNALDAVGRILDGKNELFNRFGILLKKAAEITWDFAGALKEVWPILLAGGAALAAFKLQPFITALSGASAAMPILSNSVANLSMGFAGLGMWKTASLGGLAASLGSIALVAAPAAIAIGYVIKAMKDHSAALDEAWKITRETDKEFSQLGDSLKPLVDRLIELRGKTEPTNEELAELGRLQNEIADKAPTLATGIDQQGNSILKSDEALKGYVSRLQSLASVDISTEGPVGDYEANIKQVEDLNQTWSEQGFIIDRMTSSMQALGMQQRDIDKITTMLSYDFEKGKGMFEGWLDLASESGDIDVASWWEIGQKLDEFLGTGSEASQIVSALKDDMTLLDLEYKKSGTTFGDTDNQIRELTASMQQQRPELLASARDAGLAGQAINQNFLIALKSNIPEFQSLGIEAVANYATGLLQSAGQAEPQAAATGQRIAEQLFNTGNFTATGIANIDAALQQIANQIKIDKIQEAGERLQSAWSKVAGVFSGGEKKDVTVNITDDGSASEVTGELKKTTKAAEKLSTQRPNVKVSSNTTNAHQKFSDLLTRLRNYNGQTITTVMIRAMITGSGPFTAKGYAAYLENTISSINPQVTVGIAGGTGAVKESALAHVMDIFGGNFEGGFLQQAMTKEFRDVEEAIMSITGQSGAHLEAWRNLRGEMDKSKATLDSYNERMEASQKRVEAFQKEQSKLQEVIQKSNEKISKANEELSRLTQLKLRGETVSDEKSYAMGLKLLKLERERVMLNQKVESRNATSADYKRLMEIDKEKQKLETTKQIHDLTAQITYEPQHKQIEKANNKLYGQEMTLGQILAGIKKQNGVISSQEALILKNESALKKIERRIRKEQDAQWDLKIEIENTQKVYDNLKSKVDEFANYFLQRYQEILAAAEAVRKEQEKLAEEAGKAGGGTVTIDTEYKANPTFDNPAQLVAYVNRTLNLGLKSQRIPILAPVPDVGVLAGGSSSGGIVDDHSSRTEIIHIDQVIVQNPSNLGDILDQCRQAKLNAQVQ